VEVQSLRAENSSLLQRIRLLEHSSGQQGLQNPAESDIKARCDLLVKEREAVHTIMEQKIKVLVQGVSNALSAVLQTAPMGGGPAGAALAKVNDFIDTACRSNEISLLGCGSATATG
jgi:hypothetical protein